MIPPKTSNITSWCFPVPNRLELNCKARGQEETAPALNWCWPHGIGETGYKEVPKPKRNHQWVAPILPFLPRNHGSVEHHLLNERNLILEIHTHKFSTKKNMIGGFGIRGIALQVLVTRLYLNKWLQSLVYETTWVDFRECNTGSAGTSGINPPSPKGWTEKFREEIFPGVGCDGWIFRTGKIWDAKGILVTSVAWTPGCPAIDIFYPWNSHLFAPEKWMGQEYDAVSEFGIGNSCKSSHATLWYRSSKVTMFCFPWCNGLRNLQLELLKSH